MSLVNKLVRDSVHLNDPFVVHASEILLMDTGKGSFVEGLSLGTPQRVQSMAPGSYIYFRSTFPERKVGRGRIALACGADHTHGADYSHGADHRDIPAWL